MTSSPSVHVAVLVRAGTAVLVSSSLSPSFFLVSHDSFGRRYALARRVGAHVAALDNLTNHPTLFGRFDVSSDGVRDGSPTRSPDTFCLATPRCQVSYGRLRETSVLHRPAILFASRHLFPILLFDFHLKRARHYSRLTTSPWLRSIAERS